MNAVATAAGFPLARKSNSRYGVGRERVIVPATGHVRPEPILRRLSRNKTTTGLCGKRTLAVVRVVVPAGLGTRRRHESAAKTAFNQSLL